MMYTTEVVVDSCGGNDSDIVSGSDSGIGF